MASVTITEYASGVASSAQKIEYGYDMQNLRVSAKLSLDATASGTFTHSTTTKYLNDTQNFTGYSQVIQETTFNPFDVEQSKNIYNIGLQRIGQTTYDATTPGGRSAFFHFDGLGGAVERSSFYILWCSSVSFFGCNSGRKRPFGILVRHFKQVRKQVRQSYELTFSRYQRRPLLPVILRGQRMLNRETG